MLQENVPLSLHGSYKIGGSARYFFEVKTDEELFAALDKARKLKAKLFVLGGGTNVLFSDEGFDGAVLKIAFRNVSVDGDVIRVGAGAVMADLLEAAIEKGLGGLQWAGGLPGTVGGAVRGNAGAFGGETKDSVEYVVSFDIATGKFKKRLNNECGFGYRQSIFKNDSRNEIIWEVGFRLKPDDKNEIRKAVEEKIIYRKERHPMEYPNVGSIFKNVDVRAVPDKAIEQFKEKIKTDPFPVVPTAVIIAAANMHGVSCGGAMVSPKHPNFIVNVLNARAVDVKSLINEVKYRVMVRFGINLEEEIQYL